MKLYELNHEIDRIYDEIAQAEGEISPEQEEWLEKLEGAKEVKLLNSAKYVQNLNMEVEEIEDEIARIERVAYGLKKKLRRKEAERDGFLGYVGRQLGKGHGWASAIFSFDWSHPKKVIVDESVDVRKLPERFIRYKEEYAPNKIELRRAMEKEGLSIEGIRLEEKWSLRLTTEPRSSNSEPLLTSSTSE